MIEKDKVKKILLIKLRGIGDVVLSTVVLDNLRAEFPNAVIHYLSDKPGTIAIENLKQIDKTIVFDRGSTLNRIKQILKIRNEKYDLVFDFFANPSTALITYFSGAAYRAGFPYKGRTYAYNLYGPPERDKYHNVELHLKFLEMLNLQNDDISMHFGLSKNDEKFAKDFFDKTFTNEKLIVGISPSGGWESKKCDPYKFAEFADAIVEKFNTDIFIVWGPGDKDEADEIAAKMKHKSIMAPNSSILEMGALISRCDILVANDSGPMHISTAVGTPTLSLHGPTNPRFLGPYGKSHEYILLESIDCIICNLLDCNKNHECFREIPTELVIEKVEKLFDKNGITYQI